MWRAKSPAKRRKLKGSSDSTSTLTTLDFCAPTIISAMPSTAQDIPGRNGSLDALTRGAAPAPAPSAEKSALGRRMDFQQGVQAAAQAGELGELFQYRISTPVTLSRNRSAMLPIVNEKVEGEKLSIYNEAVQPKHPLNGLRLKNTTQLHLMQGPITVFDDNLEH